jgi:DNA-binding SARP family transcriptional activator
MQFSILGPLEVRADDRAVALGGVKPRALLTVLLLRANQSVSAEQLALALWGEDAPPGSVKTVQVHISRLRRSLGDPELLVTTPGGYELRVRPGELDAEHFERCLGDGRRALVAGNPEEAAVALHEALALWRGRPLAELAALPFAPAEITRLEERRLGALELRVEADLELGRHAELIAELQHVTSEHPWRERLHGQLMLALYRSGRQADALTAYRDARRVLVDELGIEPGRPLRELETAILEQDPRLELVATSDEAAAPAEGPGDSFVGRDAQLEELRAGLDAAIGGRGRLVLVSGEPGAGKSRLADEFAREAYARGARVLAGRCWEAGGAPAYWPWVQSLRAYVRGVEPELLRAQLGTGAVELAQLLPELRELLPGLPEPASPDPVEARFRLLYATAEFLRKACAEHPTVLVLDDLHAADPPSLILLRYLARELRSMQLLVIGAFRDVDPVPGQPLSEMLGEVAREPGTRRITLSGLSAAEVTSYVDWAAPSIASPELGRNLHQKTEGNPLFVAETVRLLSDEEIQPDAEGGVRLAIPLNVRDVIARRLTYLSVECNRILLLASILGREFAVDALARLAGLPVDALLDHLDEAVAARVVTDVPGGGGRLRFAHVLIRDTLHDGLGGPRRAQLHRRAAEALEELYGTSLEGHEETPERVLALAQHWHGAHAPTRAISYYRRAGELALRVFANDEAAEALTRGVELVRQLPPSAERDEEELQLTIMLGAARGWGSPDYSRARDLSEKLGRPVSPQILRGMALNSMLRLELADAREDGIALLAAGGRDADPVLIVEGEYLLGVISFWEGGFVEARQHLQAAIDQYVPERRATHMTLYSQDPKVVCLSRLAWTLCLLGNVGEAAEARDAALALADELDHPFSCCYARLYGAIVSQHVGDEPLRAQLVDAGEAIATAERFEVLRTWLAVLRDSALASGGDPEALIAMRAAIASLETTQRITLNGYLHALVARACLVLGELTQGLAAVVSGLADARRTGARYMDSELHRVRGELLVASGADASDIETAFGLAHEIAGSQEAKALEARAAAALARWEPTRN